MSSKIKYLILLLLFTIMQNTGNAIPVDSTTLVNGHYAGSIILTNDKSYILKGFVYMEVGATLTIAPGTVIRGDFDTKGTIIIQRGAKIMATGTVTSPIVFTSRMPQGTRAAGDWGGVILLGRAGINTVSGTDSASIESLPPEQQPAFFGGQPRDDNDNSGIMRYVRIEFAGINLTGISGNEINGLTLGGVGRGTTLEYIQVSYSGDDSFEWFGGTVNCKHLITFDGLDDDYDTDNGYRGLNQFLLCIRDSNIADVSGSKAFEVDNNVNTPNNYNSPRTSAIYSNVTVIGPKKTATTTINPLFISGVHWRRNSLERIYNTVFLGWPKGILFDGFGVGRAALTDTIQFRNNIFAGATTLGDTAGGITSSGFINPTGWIQTGSFSNRSFTNNTDVLLANPFGFYSNTGDWRPAAGSPALTGSSFSNQNLSDPFFTLVTYVGAFDGVTDWTAGWSNFNPNFYDPVSINTISSKVPERYSLSQNYPNPFNPTTKIIFSIVRPGIVSLKVFDMNGRDVANLVNQNLSTGTYEYEFNGSNLSSGVYFYKMQSNDFAETKKMTILK